MSQAVILIAFALAVQQAAPPAKPGEPQVRINVVNVCSPSEADRKELEGALAKIPVRSGFAADYEVARGRTTLPDSPPSDWVRVRREFAAGNPFLNASYAISVDDTMIVETLVLRARETKDVMQISLEDQVPAAAGTPADVAAMDTPVTRIKIERFGKPSITVARCESGQEALEPLFTKASAVMASYRARLGVRTTFLGDVRRIGPKKPAAAGPVKPPRQ